MKNNRNALIALLSIFLTAVLAFSFTGCSNSTDKPDDAQQQSGAATTDEADAPAGLAALGIDPGTVNVYPDVKHDEKNAVGFQLDPPSEGDTVAVIHTTMGDITLRFFPDQAPKAVTNFINLAEANSYDKTSFHRVIADFGIQGGHCGTDENNPNGVSSFGGMFEDEFCDSLFNIRGAVSMANTSKDANGSQFFINQTTAEAFQANGGWSAYDSMWDNVKTRLENYKDSNLISAFIDENGDKFINTDIIPDSVKKLYEENGGNPNLDGAYNAADRGQTVFAQVISGMDVVDKIAAVATDKKNVPNDRVEIKSIEITTYQPTTTKP